MESVTRYRWVILGIAFLAQFSNALASQAVAPLAPLIQPELGLSKLEIGLFSTVVFAGSWGVYLAAGSLTDRFGVRRMISVGQVASGLLMLSMGMAGSFLHAAVVMFAVGAACGNVTPGGAKAVMDWFTARSRATAMGVKQTAVPLAGVATASTLPILALAIGWRSAIALVGFVIIAGGIAAAALYRDAAPQGGVVERKASMRAGVGEVLRNRSLWAVSVIAILFATAQITVITYLALYFKEIVLVPVIPDEHTRILAAGGYLALCQLGGGAGRIFWGVVSDRVFYGQRTMVLATIGALATVMSLVVGHLPPGTPLGLLAVMVFVYGTGVIGWNGLYLALLTETAGPRFAGTAVGLGMSLIQFGNIGGPLLFGFLVDATASYQTGWFFLSAVSAAGTLLAAHNASRRKRSAGTEDAAVGLRNPTRG